MTLACVNRVISGPSFLAARDVSRERDKSMIPVRRLGITIRIVRPGETTARRVAWDERGLYSSEG